LPHFIDTVDLIHLYEHELAARSPYPVQMYSRKASPRESKHWHRFEKAADMILNLGADPETFIKCQFDGMGKFQDRQLIPQPAMLCSKKAKERWQKHMGTYVASYGNRVNEVTEEKVELPIASRLKLAFDRIRRLRLAWDWGQVYEWVMDSNNWDQFENDLCLIVAMEAAGVPEVAMPLGIRESARRFLVQSNEWANGMKEFSRQTFGADDGW